MAQLKDLIVQGTTRLIGQLTTDTIQVNKIKVQDPNSPSTYSTGASGKVLKSNGTTVYWGDAVTTTTAATVSSGVLEFIEQDVGQ